MFVCRLWPNETREGKQKKKSYQTFFIMHILVGTDSSSLLAQNAFMGECRGETRRSINPFASPHTIMTRDVILCARFSARSHR